jgi:hypothetical protein
VVGIGTVSPNSYAFNDPAKLVIANTGTAGAGNTFTIASGSTGFGNLAFANGTSGTARYNGYIAYNHSSNFMAFYTNAGAERYRLGSDGTATWSVGGSTAMTLNSTGLGVGGSPLASHLIHSQGPVGIGGTGSGTRTSYISNANACSIYYTDGGASYPFDNFGNLIIQPRTSAGRSVIIATSSAAGTPVERLIVDPSGNVGVGVTPSAWGGAFKALQISRAGLRGSTATSGLSFNAYFDGTDFKYIAAGLNALDYFQNSGKHVWQIAGVAANANDPITFTEAMTLDALGNLHVGTTAYVGVGANFVNSLNGFNIVPNNTGSASNRNWQLAANGSAAGNLDFAISSANNTFPNFAYRMQLTSAGALNNTTGTYGTISDLRLKENISDARNYLADLLKLRVVKYSLKEESSAVATKLGFIAQEVEQVFPNLVDQSDVAYDGGEGIRSVKTSILIPMLLKAIQELTARVEALEA